MSDILIYCSHMEHIRSRMNIIQRFTDKQLTTDVDSCDIDIQFLNIRKILELLAFSSLIANRELYSSAHEKFSEYWRAKSMLEELEKVNPDFYPVPLGNPEEIAPGRKHFPQCKNSFLTKLEFPILYDIASEFIHAKNPYSKKKWYN